MTSGAGAGWEESDELDVWSADRLLNGELCPDASSGYNDVAELIAVVREGVQPAPSGWGTPTVPAMERIIRRPPTTRGSGAGRRWKALSYATVTMTVVTVLGVGSAAAATGQLPAPVQSVVHSAAAVAGVQVPAHRPDHTSGPGPADQSGRLSGGSAPSVAQPSTTAVTDIPVAGSAPSPSTPSSPSNVASDGAATSEDHAPAVPSDSADSADPSVTTPPSSDASGAPGTPGASHGNSEGASSKGSNRPESRGPRNPGAPSGSTPAP